MEDIWIIPVFICLIIGLLSITLFICLIIGLLSITLFIRQSIIKEEERKLREYREKIIERKIRDKMCKPKGE